VRDGDQDAPQRTRRLQAQRFQTPRSWTERCRHACRPPVFPSDERLQPAALAYDRSGSFASISRRPADPRLDWAARRSDAQADLSLWKDSLVNVSALPLSSILLTQENISSKMTKKHVLSAHLVCCHTSSLFASNSAQIMKAPFQMDQVKITLEPQACPEHLAGVEIKFGIERALNVGGLRKIEDAKRNRSTRPRHIRARGCAR
jgi:hypothetical protein